MTNSKKMHWNLSPHFNSSSWRLIWSKFRAHIVLYMSYCMCNYATTIEFEPNWVALCYGKSLKCRLLFSRWRYDDIEAVWYKRITRYVCEFVKVKNIFKEWREVTSSYKMVLGLLYTKMNSTDFAKFKISLQVFRHSSYYLSTTKQVFR